jgi:vacuolar-type H+-ATPase subunit E/Vma4
MMMVEDIK